MFIQWINNFKDKEIGLKYLNNVTCLYPYPKPYRIVTSSLKLRSTVSYVAGCITNGLGVLLVPFGVFLCIFSYICFVTIIVLPLNMSIFFTYIFLLFTYITLSLITQWEQLWWKVRKGNFNVHFLESVCKTETRLTSSTCYIVNHSNFNQWFVWLGLYSVWRASRTLLLVLSVVSYNKYIFFNNK